jgi:hypothetical protein
MRRCAVLLLVAASMFASGCAVAARSSSAAHAHDPRAAVARRIASSAGRSGSMRSSPTRSPRARETFASATT